VKKWEKDHTRELAQLGALVHKIIKMVSDAPDGKLELRCASSWQMEVRKQLPDAGDVLSKEARALWTKSAAKLGEEPEDEDSEAELSDEGSEGDWDDGTAKDLTGCSEVCGYCGKCSY